MTTFNFEKRYLALGRKKHLDEDRDEETKVWSFFGKCYTFTRREPHQVISLYLMTFYVVDVHCWGVFLFGHMAISTSHIVPIQNSQLIKIKMSNALMNFLTISL